MSVNRQMSSGIAFFLSLLLTRPCFHPLRNRGLAVLDQSDQATHSRFPTFQILLLDVSKAEIQRQTCNDATSNTSEGRILRQIPQSRIQAHYEGPPRRGHRTPLRNVISYGQGKPKRPGHARQDLYAQTVPIVACPDREPTCWQIVQVGAA